jgi:hypothetical protein
MTVLSPASSVLKQDELFGAIRSRESTRPISKLERKAINNYIISHNHNKVTFKLF